MKNKKEIIEDWAPPGLINFFFFGRISHGNFAEVEVLSVGTRENKAL